MRAFNGDDGDDAIQDEKEFDYTVLHQQLH